MWSNPYAKEVPYSLASDDDGFPQYVVNKLKSFGAEVYSVHGSAGMDFFFEIPVTPYLFDILPRWIDKTDLRAFRWNVFDTRGWPMQSLWCALEAYESVNPVGCKIHGGLRVGQSQIVVGWRRVPRTVPLRPPWLGFTINTVFYAGLLWLISLGPFTALRIIRRKRGLCIKCGYDLRSDFEQGCPECGWGREAEG